MGGKDLNRHFSREDLQMANTHMKRCSKPLMIREMQIKTSWGVTLTPVRTAIIKKILNDKCFGNGAEKREPSYCWWEHKLVWPLKRTIWRFLKKLKIKLPCEPAILLLRHVSEENHNSKGGMRPNAHHSAIDNSQAWANPKMSIDRGMDTEDIPTYNGVLLSHKKGMKWCHLQRCGWT